MDGYKNAGRIPQATAGNTHPPPTIARGHPQRDDPSRDNLVLEVIIKDWRVSPWGNKMKKKSSSRKKEENKWPLLILLAEYSVPLLIQENL